MRYLPPIILALSVYSLIWWGVWNLAISPETSDSPVITSPEQLPPSNQTPSDEPTDEPEPKDEPTDDRIPDSPSPSAPGTLPDQANLDMVFYPQAPDGNWSLPWEEACEEASIALAYHYVVGDSLSVADFKSDILAMVDWQKENFGHYEDTNVAQTARLLEGYYGFTDFEVVALDSIEQLKGYLADGKAVVAPMAGRHLGNPYYANGGPDYHMMVVKGYDAESFITHDVGTRRGENYPYPHQIFFDAISDWGGDGLEWGPKRVIVLGN